MRRSIHKSCVRHGGGSRKLGSNLTGPNECIEHVRPRFHHEKSKDGAPRVADKKYFVPMQLLLQQFRKLNTVLDHSVRCNRGSGGRSVSSERSPGTALVPLHNGEILEPTAKRCVSPGIGGIAGPAVQEEQHRVVAVLAANRDPLVDSADLDIVVGH